jgi:hypothetical protein
MSKDPKDFFGFKYNSVVVILKQQYCVIKSKNRWYEYNQTKKKMMHKAMFPCLYLLLQFLSMAMVGAQNPYFVAFHHPLVNITYGSCVPPFKRIFDAVYRAYVSDVLATTNMTKAQADAIDPLWTNRTTVRRDRGRNLQTTYTSTCTKKICKSHNTIVISRRCCDICTDACDSRRRLNEGTTLALRGNDMARRTQGLVMDVRPVIDNSTGFIVVSSAGNKGVLTGMNAGKKGTEIAKMFYEMAEYSVRDRFCSRIFMMATYKIMEMQVVWV